jgi:DNA invertase Pin-like site-specific DNA recombinase
MMGAFAEFERALILERQREGIQIAKKAGVYKGRKPKLNADQVQQIHLRAKAGESKSDLARIFGVSRETLYSYLRTGPKGSLCTRMNSPPAIHGSGCTEKRNS